MFMASCMLYSASNVPIKADKSILNECDPAHQKVLN